jgi:hypothetical protein
LDHNSLIHASYTAGMRPSLFVEMRISLTCLWADLAPWSFQSLHNFVSYIFKFSILSLGLLIFLLIFSELFQINYMFFSVSFFGSF